VLGVIQWIVRGPGCRVHHVRILNANTFVLRFERRGLPFEPGQYVNLGLRGSIAMREYSIYSGAGDDYLEVLVREVEGGLVSRALRRCEPGDELSVEGPYGTFVTGFPENSGRKFLFIGSGTGISPFHCIVRSYPGIDYLLLHGVRSETERYDADAFDPARSVCCASRSADGGFRGNSTEYRGRVTDWLRGHPADPRSLCMLCGNGAMISDASSILRSQGVPRNQLSAETYF